MKNSRYQGPDYDREAEEEEIQSGPSPEELTQAEATFRAALAVAGIDADVIAQFASLGPVLVMRKWEADQLRFTSPASESAFAAALNAWGKANYPR